MARDVADTALLYDAIRGPHVLDPFGQGRARDERRSLSDNLSRKRIRQNFSNHFHGDHLFAPTQKSGKAG